MIAQKKKLWQIRTGKEPHSLIWIYKLKLFPKNKGHENFVYRWFFKITSDLQKSNSFLWGQQTKWRQKFFFNLGFKVTGQASNSKISDFWFVPKNCTWLIGPLLYFICFFFLGGEGSEVPKNVWRIFKLFFHFFV